MARTQRLPLLLCCWLLPTVFSASSPSCVLLLLLSTTLAVICTDRALSKNKMCLTSRSARHPWYRCSSHNFLTPLFPFPDGAGLTRGESPGGKRSGAPCINAPGISYTSPPLVAPAPTCLLLSVFFLLPVCSRTKDGRSATAYPRARSIWTSISPDRCRAPRRGLTCPS